MRIRRLSELNEEDVLKPKPRQKLNAKKEKLADSISESIQMQHETQSINTLLKEKPQFNKFDTWKKLFELTISLRIVCL